MSRRFGPHPESGEDVEESWNVRIQTPEMRWDGRGFMAPSVFDIREKFGRNELRSIEEARSLIADLRKDPKLVGCLFWIQKTTTKTNWNTEIHDADGMED